MPTPTDTLEASDARLGVFPIPPLEPLGFAATLCEVHRAAERVEQAAVLDDATGGVALIEEFFWITPDEIVDPLDADATQILGDRRTDARNDLEVHGGGLAI